MGEKLSQMRLDIYLLWRKGFPAALARDGQPEMLSKYFPDARVGSETKWAISDFYDNVHIPSNTLKMAPEIQHTNLECDLYPFQQRAVDWLLRREGMHFRDGRLQPLPDHEKHPPPSCFRPVQDVSGRQTYISNVHGMALNQPPRYHSLPGGILCEEMGLGKTVELLALISLHKRKAIQEGKNAWGLFESGATLIITPTHLSPQWQSEISRHAPNLRVLNYTGIQSLNKKIAGDHDAEELLKYDIVLTTYNVLSKEIHYAEKPPERNFRHGKKHEPRRSPLVQIAWWRICLDEAQMIESGVTKAAIVARLIPRVNAWAVSGTPLKKNLEDLFGLLLFLGYQPFCDSKKFWSRVDKALFKDIINQIALRHTKDMIRQELRLPPQKRVVITMPFTAIEDQNYSQLIQQMCNDCGLTPEGAPLDNDIDFESPVLSEKMRSWLRRLRQTCLHPQVGGRNRRALGRGNRPLKTVDEVLDIMIDQNETSLRAEQRQVVLSQVRYAHIIANDRSNTERWSKALEIYKTALDKATGHVEVIRKELAVEKEKNPTAERRKTPDTEDDSDSEDEFEEKSEAYARIAALQKTLRAALEVKHVCAFFVGTAYFQQKEQQDRRDKKEREGSEMPLEQKEEDPTADKDQVEKKEDEQPKTEEFNRLESLEIQYYDQAKAMRKEMLREWNDSAQHLMGKVDSRRGNRRMPEIPSLKDFGGIESRKFLEKLDDLQELLEKQAEFMDKLYGKAVEYLLLPLIDEDEGKDTTGEEYEDSTKKQDELYVYISLLRASVADRHKLITGQGNVLIDHEIKEANKVAKEGQGHAPELFLALFEDRKKLLPREDSQSLRAIITEIRSTATTLQWQSVGGSVRAGSELAVVERQAKEAQQISSTQGKFVDELEKDLDLFTKTMNQRLEFYRQLQIISDTVAPYKELEDETIDLYALEKQKVEQQKSEERLATLNTKRRFLMHLRDEASEEDARICVICQSSFETGVLTVCGHQYCKECIRLWWREHRTCPVCKRHLHLVDFHDITYKPSELRAEEEQHPSASPSKSEASSSSSRASTAIYSDINASTLREIKSVDIRGSYGTKIDTIARHLLWIREHDPGAKALIYSQYSDFLQVLGGALKHFKIGYATFSGKSGVEAFKKDASIECFLLEATANSSGLNLVNATYVFLCEPMINPAIELQAIARVHRIGQQRSTTVYMYLISETVEQQIYDISVGRRLAHIGSNGATREARSGTQTPQAQEIALDAANSMELQAAPISTLLTKGKSGGEVVDKGDLWNCLFGGRTSKREKLVSGEMAQEVGRFLRAEAADARAEQQETES